MDDIQKKKSHLHFVGIGGIGMSGIAEVFHNQGYSVSGSDMGESDTTLRLREIGIRVALGHHAENLGDASVVVISSAVKPTNPEVVEARRRRIPIIPRAEMLGELMRGKVGLAVAGTHGKTTTTSMLGCVLMEAGLDPTVVVGGKVDSLGGNAKHGAGKFVVAEADESDGSFLHLPATYGIITNIDNDHLDHFGTLEAIENLFVDFVAQLPFYGMAAVCGEDPGVLRCVSRFNKPFVTYGFKAECDFSADQIRLDGMGSEFTVHHRSLPKEGKKFRVNVPGRHNVLNALAVVSLGHSIGISFDQIARGLAQFRGVKRRFEVRWKHPNGKKVIIDDYGHHPTEIAATLSAARLYWQGRIVAAFQPHRYTRTLHCMNGFLTAFKDADVVVITDIYPAGEDPIPGIDGQTLSKEISKNSTGKQEVLFGGDLTSTRDKVLKKVTDGDLILCLGAGSITKLPDQLIAALGST
jgi:UDP-N-acetylmuramate--alanine ligase